MPEHLPSWNDTETTRRIVQVVRNMADETSDTYVSPAERIATVDNDGTLWCEKPLYIQADFLFRRFAEIARADPAKAATQPYKAVLARDMEYLGAISEHLPELVKAISEAYAGITPEAFEAAALAFFGMAQHPRFGVPYAKLTYAPMQELLELLRANRFKVFIATGGGRDFVRAIAETFYDIPRERVIGSAGGLEYKDGALVRTPTIEMPVDDGAGKPVHIYARIGMPPALAIGNSDGDFEMMEYAKVSVLIHHDDAEREYAYMDGTERAIKEAPKQGWTVVSMKNDWTKVFADK